MSALSIEIPYQVFFDKDGMPLENGYVWIGQANQNPQTNPVQVYFDSDLTQLAQQPLRTLNGYVSNAGTPAQVYIDGVDFSILVQDKNGTIIYNFPKGTGIDPSAASIVYQPAGIGAVPTTVQTKLRETVSVKDFGAVGDGVTDDTAAIQAAVSAVNGYVYFPPGTYNLNSTVFFEHIVKPCRGFIGAGRRSTIIKWTGGAAEIFRVNGFTANFSSFTVDGNNTATHVFLAVVGGGSGDIVASQISATNTQYFYATTATINNQADNVFYRCVFQNGISFIQVNQEQGVNFYAYSCITNFLSGPVFDFVQGGDLVVVGHSVKDAPTLLKVGNSSSNYFFSFYSVFNDAGKSLQLVDAKTGQIYINQFVGNTSGGLATKPCINITNSSATVKIENSFIKDLYSSTNPVFDVSGLNVNQAACLNVENCLIVPSSPPNYIYAANELLRSSNVYSFVTLKNSFTRIASNTIGFIKGSYDLVTTFYTTADLPATGDVFLNINPVSTTYPVQSNFDVVALYIDIVGGSFTGTDSVQYRFRRRSTNQTIGSGTVLASGGLFQYVDVSGSSWSSDEGLRLALNANNNIANITNIRFSVTVYMKSTNFRR